MTRRDDDQLLEHLGAALAPPATEPSAAEVEALHRMVAGHDDAVATVTPLPRRGMGWRLGLVATAALVLVVALVANRPGGEPRSPELARAQASLAELQTAIEQRDPNAILPALSELQRRVRALEPGERALIEPEVKRLEREALALLPPLPPVPTTTAPQMTPGSSTIPAAPRPGPSTTVDDKGGQRDHSGSNSGRG